MLDLIKEYNLGDKVKVYNYTNNPLDEFRKSKASLLTSKYEGFGLTVMESIEVGCQLFHMTLDTVQVKLLMMA